MRADFGAGKIRGSSWVVVRGCGEDCKAWGEGREGGLRGGTHVRRAEPRGLIKVECRVTCFVYGSYEYQLPQW